MRIIFFGRYVDALHPSPRQQRPQKHRAGDDEEPETPASVRRVRVDLPRANQREWDGEEQSYGEISAKQAESDDGDVHGNKSGEL